MELRLIEEFSVRVGAAWSSSAVFAGDFLDRGLSVRVT